LWRRALKSSPPDAGARRASRGGDALKFIRTDVAIEGDVEAMVSYAVATFCRLDCVVNNAGVGSPWSALPT
jgi:NAD(P)-dependent dehydrogenase (short-subunit alcohol dehydrogenase family)